MNITLKGTYLINKASHVVRHTYISNANKKSLLPVLPPIGINNNPANRACHSNNAASYALNATFCVALDKKYYK